MERTQYIIEAAKKGAETGEFFAGYMTGARKQSIHKCAVSFVNRLPLNDIAFEASLVSVYETAANAAAEVAR